MINPFLDRLERGPILADGDPERVSDTVYRVKLRRGATFHDGTRVTPADVVASFKRLTDPTTGSFLASYLTVVKAVRPAGADAVEFTLAFPTVFFEQRVGLVKVIPSSRATAKPNAAIFNTRPVGSGPYQVTSISGDLRAIRLKRAQRYDGRFRRSFTEVGVDVILDDQSRISALQTGRLAAMNDPPYQAVDKLDRSDSLSAGGAQSFQQSILLFNCKKAPFDDRRVRQAILYAINRDEITRKVFFGRAEAATSYLPSYHPDYVEPTTRIGYDPEKARALLAAAGASNLRFQLNLSNPGWLAPQGTLIQSDLKAVGVDVSIRQAETESLVKYAVDGSYSAWLTPTDPTVFGTTDAQALIFWVYENLAPGFIYWTDAKAKEMARLLDRALRTQQRDELRPLYGQMQNMIAEEVPAFPLHHRQNVAAWSNRVELKPDPVYVVNALQARAAGA
jgi:peptide/nickel transport system substrate-binding protein